MSTELGKVYNPKETEDIIYKLWEESGFFTPENLPGKRKEKFTTMIAPPNITGELHMGHALENSLMDIVVRMKRMQGYKTLWLPGTDHAGIGAQNVVEKQLAKEGMSRHELGREKFIERMWQWRDKFGGIILDQLKKLGCSFDWSKTRFTMDEEYQRAVNEAFVHYYRKGWIYKGVRVVNWCPRCATSISDLEVEYAPEKAFLYYIKYGSFTLATVRPETKLGDTGLAVHPKDNRYKNHIGKEIEIESVDNNTPREEEPRKKNIKIRVVDDESVDPEFGTGIIKVTPAHDITDSEIAQRHSLEFLKIIDERARMTKEAGLRYEGLKIKEARELIVSDLKKLGLLVKEDPYEHNIGRCERCNSIIEPLPSEQWFLKMEKLVGHAKKALKKKLVVFHPDRWRKPYSDWLDKVRDWNISRQLWWGHRLPVWIHDFKCIPRPGHEKEISKCLEIKVSIEEPACKYCDAKYIQSDDVLDTWFSSALWPFAALGWPSFAKASEGQSLKKKDLKEYYPTQLITSAREILYLWIIRMIFSGMEFMDKAPFKDIYIHPTVLTKEGKRMSKSLGTGVDPLVLIEKYGADAVRFGLAYQNTGVQDIKFNEDVIAMGKKFANKIWNAARFALMQLPTANCQLPIKLPKNLPETEKKIIEDLKTTVKSVTYDIESFCFGQAAYTIYHFFWDIFCDKYLEYTKRVGTQESKLVLFYVLTESIKILHPFMPFLTEEIYGQLPIGNKKMLIVENWPG